MPTTAKAIPDPDLHHHYTSSGGHTLTHTHPGGRSDHEGRHPEHHGNDRGAYYSRLGPAPVTRTNGT